MASPNHEQEDMDKRSSALVAPLNIHKSPSRSCSPITATTTTPIPQLSRAFYHYNPTSTVSSSSTDESSITVAIKQGDVILVHSVHPNGWADGTLLASGARGWLPTNYCEPYDHPIIRNLLTALTYIWDLVRDGENGDLVAFSRQDYVRGMIVGVRLFLERTECLQKDSPLVLAHVGLRRMRKALLGDLSTLLVTRAVRFLDIWTTDAVSLSLFELDDVDNRPLTPPSDAAVEPITTSAPSTDDSVSANACDSPVTQASGSTQDDWYTGSAQFVAKLQPPSSILHSQSGFQSKRTSMTLALSYTGKSFCAHRGNLASEKLNTAHRRFSGASSASLSLRRQKNSVVACKQLLTVVEEGSTRRHVRPSLTELVQATRSMFSRQMQRAKKSWRQMLGKQIVKAATSCVRAAGLVTLSLKLRLLFGTEEKSIFQEPSPSEQQQQPTVERPASPKPNETAMETNKPLPAPPAEEPEKPLPPVVPSESKPLPESTADPQPVIVESPTAASFRSSRASLPPLDAVPTPVLNPSTLSESAESPASATQESLAGSLNAESVIASVTDSASTYRSSARDGSVSVESLVSTRATTPDHSPSKKQSCQTLVSSVGSCSELQQLANEDVAAGEEHLLETTYVHELVYNKDGQISGGSLPALVEQLTTYESTPDIVFVNAFYLTFRLFTTPTELAQCLIDRFDYIGSSQTVGVPVRLRVYNVFKGWLESHWSSDTDCAALGVILAFATGKLRAAMPGAGKRLAELTSKVTEVRAGALVPRLVSSIGKTGASNATFTPADSNVPTPLVSKSQLNALRASKDGKAQCSIMDFDPLELARQFTIIESKLFCAIQPEELLALEWTKKKDSKAHNVKAMSTLSTDLANLVADTILQLEDAKKRAVIIKQWVKIAAKCLELHNYDSLMAIICSLNSSMIMRLKRTWDLVSTKTKARLDELKAITDVGRNYAVLRQRLQDHIAPCIPFVGIYLTDLTFIDVGNGTTRQLPGDSGSGSVSVINFDKHMKTAKIICQLQSFQVPYRLAAVPEMQDWMDSQIQRMRASDQANVQNYYRRSLLLEPRDTQHSTRGSPSIDNSAQSILSTESRTTSKDKFEFLNFNFSTSNLKGS
ncbi:ras guanine nucleotide exchange factor domain-containing protein [Bipolaris maydis]|nr:ras guanine nucleotide exchange factor domain-containing protein [Bipolaris maydis]